MLQSAVSHCTITRDNRKHYSSVSIVISSCFLMLFYFRAARCNREIAQFFSPDFHLERSPPVRWFWACTINFGKKRAIEPYFFSPDFRIYVKTVTLEKNGCVETYDSTEILRITVKMLLLRLCTPQARKRPKSLLFVVSYHPPLQINDIMESSKDVRPLINKIEYFDY